jgi:hypothetical protein
MERKLSTPRLALNRETLLQLDEKILRQALGQEADSDYCTTSVRSRSGCIFCGTIPRV